MKVSKILLIMVFGLMSISLYSNDTAVFKKKCGACHTLANVSKGNQGPDLTGYVVKRPEDYIKAYMANPAEAKTKFPDIYEKEVKGKYKFTMPTAKLTDSEKISILNVLK